VGQGLRKALLGETVVPATGVTPTAASATRWTGIYASGAARFVVTFREGRLFAKLDAQSVLPLFGFSPEVFLFKVVPAQLTFSKERAGSFQHLELLQNGARIPFERISP